MSNPLLTAEGTNAPNSLANAKSAKKITSTAEDNVLQRMLDAAIEVLEESTGKAFRLNTYKLRLQSFTKSRFYNEDTCSIGLPWCPLVTITSVDYVDEDGATQTLSTDVYEVNIYSEPGQIRLKDGQSWPTVKEVFNPITITYTAGYNNTTVDNTTPKKLVQAIELIFGEYYMNREDYAGRRLPNASEVLIYPHKVIW